MALSVVALVACNAGHDYSISGTWEGGDGNIVYLRKHVTDKQYDVVDSVEVRGGTFLLSGTMKEIDKRQLAAGTAKRDILLDDVPIRVTVTSKLNEKTGQEKQQLTVVGSPEQALVEEFNNIVLGKGFVTLGGMLMMMRVKDDSLKLDSAYRSVEALKQGFDQRIRALLDTTSDRIAATFFISDFLVKEYPFSDVEYYYERLSPRVKKTYPGKQLTQKISELKQVNIGGIAPEIDLPTPDGATLKLSSLRGKYVLVDFWASWCGPCIAEVPNVKAVYDKYHDRGFEILGVSLDDKSDKWKAAIEKHALGWPHVSSLKGWSCPVAAQYNVTGIPKTFLLDREGRIIGIDLRGSALGERVSALFEGDK
jgi:peroxiredoxin